MYDTIVEIALLWIYMLSETYLEKLKLDCNNQRSADFAIKRPMPIWAGGKVISSWWEFEGKSVWWLYRCHSGLQIGPENQPFPGLGAHIQVSVPWVQV